MKKEEFLKQENVPQFIKDLVASAPGNPDISMTTLKVDGRKEDGCSCRDCDKCKEVSYPDGLDISPYLSSIGDMACDMVDMTDSQGRIKKEDVTKALGYVDCISGTVAQLFNFLSSYVGKGK